MKSRYLLGLVALLAIGSSPSYAAVTLDFEGSSDSANPGSTAVAVDTFYDGGTDSGGSSGTDYGVTFTNANFDSTSQYTQPGFNITSAIAYMPNTPLIVSSEVAFTSLAFDAFFFAGGNVVNIYSGADGTGTLLATQTFGQNCTPFCAPTTDSMSSFGNALSFTISPNANYTGIDNLTLGLIPAVPEPEVWALMLLGFAGIGLQMRRRRAAFRTVTA